MKTMLLTLTLAITAQINAKTLCADAAVKAAVIKNVKLFNVATGSCGVKVAATGTDKEVFTVCTSDETDPMEYTVVISKIYNDEDNTKVTCKVEYVDILSQAKTPNFENNDHNIKAVKCSKDSKGSKIVCKN